MIKIVDTTLRDGEQRPGISLGFQEKITIAKLLDKLNVYQIEVGIPAMDGSEKRAIQKIAELGLKSKILVWNRLSISDLDHSFECGNVCIHISVPSSDIQINHKLKKDRYWVIENLKKCADYVKSKGYSLSIGLEDASRADFNFICELIKISCEFEVEKIRYADTVGILYREATYENIKKIKEYFNVDVEFHAHNDFGMAVSNSIAAVYAGAKYIDCTIGGIGERAGNCDYYKFISACQKRFNCFNNIEKRMIKKIQNHIERIIAINNFVA
ncbi:homocitrate synthase [Caldicellulosiruptoraceae bacterium PP1]